MKIVPHKAIPDPYEAPLRALYETHAFPLWQFAYALLRSRELAEEAVNDVFLSLWEKRVPLEGIRRIYPYLCQAVKHKALDYLRASKNRDGWSAAELETDHLTFVLNPEHILLNKELAGRLSLAVQHLPPRCRLIFRLVKEDGLKCREVAELLHLSVRTVEAQLAIALKKIGQSLLPYLPEQEILQRSRSQK